MNSGREQDGSKICAVPVQSRIFVAMIGRLAPRAPWLLSNPGLLLALTLALLLVPASRLLADGGAVLTQQKTGPYLVTLFGSPAPLRAGPADLSVMIQDAATGAPVLDQSVSIKVQAAVDPHSTAWVPPCCSMRTMTGVVPATHAAAQNKLLYAANVILPSSGPHELIVRIGGDSSEILTTSLAVEPPAPPVTSYWMYLALPPVLIGAFALNQRIRRRG